MEIIIIHSSLYQCRDFLTHKCRVPCSSSVRVSSSHFSQVFMRLRWQQPLTDDINSHRRGPIFLIKQGCSNQYIAERFHGDIITREHAIASKSTPSSILKLANLKRPKIRIVHLSFGFLFLSSTSLTL